MFRMVLVVPIIVSRIPESPVSPPMPRSRSFKEGYVLWVIVSGRLERAKGEKKYLDLFNRIDYHILHIICGFGRISSHGIDNVHGPNSPTKEMIISCKTLSNDDPLQKIRDSGQRSGRIFLMEGCELDCESGRRCKDLRELKIWSSACMHCRVQILHALPSSQL